MGDAPDKTPQFLKKHGVSIAAILFFALISLLYFTPAVFEGRSLFQQDVAGASGTAQDVRDYEAETGEHSYWTGSLFGGMPMYQVSPSYPSTKLIYQTEQLITLQKPFDIMKGEAWLLFAMLVGFFIFMRSLDVKPLGAMLGAVFWTFSSYFIILIVAGHIWKLMALCFIPPTIAGMIWIYRGKYLSGSFALILFTALQIWSNHVQMSYYFLFVMAALFIAFLVEAVRKKELAKFLRSSLIVLAAGLIGVAMNLTNLYHTYEYSKETMRGGSQLTLQKTGEEANDAKHENKSGLTKDYITQWSYGIGETWTLLVPNVKGGATGYLGAQESTAEKISDQVAQPELAQFVAGQNHYWGDQPFTAGPVYVGAFVLLLFILGCFIVKGPVKWALFAVTILTVMLSWGRNFMPLTSLFIDYFPMYDKFRTVSSILVVAEFTIPVLAILGLVEFIKNPKAVVQNKAAIIASLGLTAGITLLFALAPGVFFKFLSAQETQYFKEAALQSPIYGQASAALIGVRKSVFQADAWRSFFIILFSLVPLVLYYYGKMKAGLAMCIVGVISFVDLWAVDKRYLNDSHFIEQTQVEDMASPKTFANEQILQDKTPAYRVMNFSVNDPFSDATTSRWHRSVGGYHAAKLQRYQDLITYQLAQNNFEVYNMLNTRYFILPNESSGQTMAQFNPEAYGPAWLANNIKWVDSDNEEMLALNMGNTDLRQTAIIHEQFATNQRKALPQLQDSTASIALTKYAPNELVYEVNSKQPVMAVFSEIYYPHGWTATINGNEAEILRANYVLRALDLPAGKNEVVFRFDPKTIKTTEAIAFSAIALFCLLAIALVVRTVMQQRKKKTK